MKFYIVYKITNLINEKVYIGRHSTNNINDNYMGSGTELREDMKRVGRKNFSKEILFVFDNWKEMVDKETELLTKEFVNSENTYNATNQGTGLITHGPAAREKLRKINTGLVSVRDVDGKVIRIPVSDPRYVSGELPFVLVGKFSARDQFGNTVFINKDDERWKRGELVGIHTGTKKSREVVDKHIEFMKDYWKENTHSEQGLEKMRLANIGKVNVKDKDGNEFRVDCDDPRIKSGELVNASKGSVWIHKTDIQKKRFVRPEKVQGYLDEGWELGLVYFNRKKIVFVSKPELNIQKKIEETELEAALNGGWVKGTIKQISTASEIKKSRLGGKWMHNTKTNHKRIIPTEEIEKYILDGWVIGYK